MNRTARPVSKEILETKVDLIVALKVSKEMFGKACCEGEAYV